MSLQATSRPLNNDEARLRYLAGQELLARRKAAEKLIAFTQYVSPYFQATPFHMYLANALDDVIAGVCDRLIISTPPQHGKSSVASEHFPAYYLGHNPDHNIVLCSYTMDLASEQSDKARTVLESDAFQRVFPNVRVRPDRRAMERWKLDGYRGGVRAAGVGGGISGYPAKLGIIDDPIKDWKEAQSRTVREDALNWYDSAFARRVSQDGAIIIIGTRWHQDDLIGKLIKREGHKWRVIRLPALAETQEDRDSNNKFLGLPIGESDPLGREPGEALAPFLFDEAYHNEWRQESPKMFAVLGQGVPRPTEGDKLKRQWFKRIHAMPHDVVKRVRYWDKAASDEGNGPRTAGVLIALTNDKQVIVENAVTGWFNIGDRERIIKETAESDALRYGSKSAVKIYIEQEPGSGGKESADATVKNLMGFRIEKDRPSGDKDTRLEPFIDQAQAGNVSLYDDGRAWVEDYIEEMIAVPNGIRRDQADATAGAFNKLTGSDSAVVMRQAKATFK